MTGVILHITPYNTPQNLPRKTKKQFIFSSFSPFFHFFKAKFFRSFPQPAFSATPYLLISKYFSANMNRFSQYHQQQLLSLSKSKQILLKFVKLCKMLKNLYNTTMNILNPINKKTSCSQMKHLFML